MTEVYLVDKSALARVTRQPQVRAALERLDEHGVLATSAVIDRANRFLTASPDRPQRYRPSSERRRRALTGTDITRPHSLCRSRISQVFQESVQQPLFHYRSSGTAHVDRQRRIPRSVDGCAEKGRSRAGER